MNNGVGCVSPGFLHSSADGIDRDLPRAQNIFSQVLRARERAVPQPDLFPGNPEITVRLFIFMKRAVIPDPGTVVLFRGNLFCGRTVGPESRSCR